ncbi:hypothetical protein [Streptomyces sp. NPDC002328]|uniref:hypothetical protein n=1 Tax=Streptomyces sp. NPDC002328 TaxID=3364642 RepID=UPI0036921E18
MKKGDTFRKALGERAFFAAAFLRRILRRETHMQFRVRGMLLAGTVGTVMALTGFSALTMANAAPQTTTAVPGAAHDAGAEPPYAIEDFGYPDAEEIRKQKGITLRRGDGGITLTDCSAPHQIQVWTLQNTEGRYCFRTTGKSGYLTLEVNRVHAIRTDDRAVRASLTTEGQTTTVDVPKNDYKPVGEGDEKDPRPAVLVELRVTGSAGPRALTLASHSLSAHPPARPPAPKEETCSHSVRARRGQSASFPSPR